MSGPTVSACDRCTELGTRLRNPELVEFAGATRYVMVSHLIAAHGATGDPEPGCGRCAAPAEAHGISPQVAAIWQRHHYVGHALSRRLADAPTSAPDEMAALREQVRDSSTN